MMMDFPQMMMIVCVLKTHILHIWISDNNDIYRCLADVVLGKV